MPEFNEDIIVRDSADRQVFHFNDSTAWLSVGAAGNEGDIEVKDGAGRRVFRFDGNSAWLSVGADGNEGDIEVKDGAGRRVFHLDGNTAALYIGANGNEGDLIVRDGAGNERIRLDGSTGDIRLQGADCAEEFDVLESDTVDPGTVLVIADHSMLRPCDQPYDRRVAGVVSGGNGSNPAIILDQNPAQHKRLPIALNGKVYCKVDAQSSPIKVGDLLTTSPVVGHAMKAQDPLKAFGAVIGKALRGLEQGRGLIPILVSLQ